MNPQRSAGAVALLVGWRAGALFAVALAQGIAAQPGFAGDERCRACHPAEYASFKRTGMGRSMRPASTAEDFGGQTSPVTLDGPEPGVSYSVQTRDGKLLHGEKAIDSAGQEIFSEAHEVAYCVGSGRIGHSYLTWRGDSLFVSPLSYYSNAGRWDLTPGYDIGQFHGFTRPAGELCVYCHGGLQLIRHTFNRFQPSPSGTLAIGCERCHGPGQKHLIQKTAASIVNPAKLSDTLRDDVCNQCHLAGDARVLKPGKSYADFTPGTPLDDIVSIFSVPTAMKPSGLRALTQVDQLHASRCWTATSGRLGCITCHNPHAEPRGVEVAAFYRARCLNCHASHGCSLPLAQRERSTPPNNCISCHMPPRTVTNISHAALTDHRILRSAKPPESSSVNLSAPPNLILETQTQSSSADTAELRASALAYAQVAENYPAFGAKGFPVLKLAAETLSRDAEVQATYGLVLLKARPAERLTAEAALERAIELRSPSLEARIKLAGLRLEEGKFDSAIRLCEDAIQIDPYLSAAYLRLARAYGSSGDHCKAAAALDRVLSFDPGNDSARQGLSAERKACTGPK